MTFGLTIEGSMLTWGSWLPGTPIIATTATANDRVVSDLNEQLKCSLVLRGTLDRESLAIRVLAVRGAARRLAWLADRVPELPGSGIIYTLTVADANDAAAFLQKRKPASTGLHRQNEGCGQTSL